jgi:uncharacterized integral membrane protein
MNSLNSSQDLLLDEQVAQFTDRVLSGNDEMEGEAMATDIELARLQKTILRLRVAAQVARPAPATTARLRQYLLAEWAKQRAADEKKAKTQNRRAWWPFQKNSLALGTVALIILVFALITLPNTVPVNLSGTATGSASAVIGVIIFGVVVIGVIFVWLTRRK